MDCNCTFSSKTCLTFVVIQLILQLIQIVSQLWHLHLEVLALAVVQDKLLNLSLDHSISWHVIPMIENALWECLSTRLLTQSCNEAEGLGHRKICLHLSE